MKVVVCDDDLERVQDWASSLQEVLPDAEVVTPDLGQFARAIRDLGQRLRRSMSEHNSDGAWSGDAASMFDDADVLVLDSDLTPAPGGEHDPTEASLIDAYLVSEMGGDVADLARNFSKCGAIVVLNEISRIPSFDVTFMRFAEKIAEVYISDDQIGDPGLWNPNLALGFRPSYWPDLAALPMQMHDAIAALAPSHALVEALGLSGAPLDDLLYGRQLEALGVATAASVADLRIQDVAVSSRLGLGLRPRVRLGDQQLLRIGTWGLRRWLDRWVLPAQNLIVDLPHLLQRRPWLVGDRDNLEAWNRLSGCWYPEEPEVHPEAFNSSASAILGRNVWNVFQLSDSPEGSRVEPSDPVFCEDSSTFRLWSDAKSVLSDVEGGDPHRFLGLIPDIAYSPRARLAR